MDPHALLAYALTLLALYLRFVGLTLVQGRARLTGHVFRHPEDAAHWGGEARARELEVVERAQAALRNDGESQPFFLLAALVWVLVGVEGAIAAGAFGLYVVARTLHAWWMLRPRQPARNRAFGISQVVILGVVIDVVRRAILGFG
ncbi:MAG: MAPEG family protein [Sandaracinus sp.]|nr:MAPEG family protein [Sandaracinus sp.]